MQKSIHTPEYAHLLAEIKAIRLSADLTQRQLAARLKVTHSWIAKVEMGERRLDLIEFCRIVVACGGEPNTAFNRIWGRIADSIRVTEQIGRRRK